MNSSSSIPLTTTATASTMNPFAAVLSDLESLRNVTAILMTITVAMINMALGAAIGKVELMSQWRVPGGVLIGSITQFVLFPLLALGIAHMFRLPSPYVTGMVLVAVCPGDAMANVVTFFVDGNICLSASLILTSTIISMGYIPVVLLIMTHSLTSGAIAVSLWAVLISIVIIAVPLMIGVLVRSFRETWAKVVIAIGITVGLVAFLAHSLFHLIFNTEAFHAPARVYFAVLFLPIVGFFLALLVAFLFGQHATSRQTLAVNAVFHNTALTLMILSTTFADDPMWKQLVVVPIIYGPIAVIFGVVYIILYLTVVVSDENDDDDDVGRDRAMTLNRRLTSGYQPIDEAPSGKGEYAALEGDDDDVANEITRGKGRLQVGDYEVVSGSVHLKTITMPVLQ